MTNHYSSTRSHSSATSKKKSSRKIKVTVGIYLAAEVEIVKVEVLCPDRPGGTISLDFSKKDKAFQIK